MKALMKKREKILKSVLAAVVAVLFFMIPVAKMFDPLGVYAETQLQELVTAGQGASVSAGETSTGEGETSKPRTGLTVRGDAGYKANVNGVFKGDTALSFAFLSNAKAYGSFGGIGYGDFAFIVSDALDPSVSFEIRFVQGWVNEVNTDAMRAYVKYTDASGNTRYRSSDGWNVEESQFGILGYIDGVWAGTNMNTKYSSDGTMSLKLKWNDDKLSVVLKDYYQDHDLVIASFDGTEQIKNASVQYEGLEYGLPKLADMKTHGYTIAFSSSYADNGENGVDICLTEIVADGVRTDLTGKKPIADPSWYVDYKEVMKNKVTIEVQGEVAEYWSPALGDFIVPSATYTVGMQAAVKNVEKIELIKEGGAARTVYPGAVSVERGRYTLCYTAVVGASYSGNTMRYTFVVDEYPMAEGLIAAERNASVTAAKTTDDGKPRTGLTVNGASGYQARFAGKFTGDTSFTFAFLSGGKSGNSYYGIGYGDFTFTIADAADPDNRFEIRLVQDWTQELSDVMRAYVTYTDENGQEYYRSSDGYVVATKELTEEEKKDHPEGEPDKNNVGFIDGKWAGHNMDTKFGPDGNMVLKLRWTGDVLDVVMTDFYENHDMVIASFDGTQQTSSTTVKYERLDFALPKLDSMKTNGYTVSFSSEYRSYGEDGVDICFTEMNGISLRSSVLSDMELYGAAGEIYVPQEDIRIAGTKDALSLRDYDIGATAQYQLEMGSFSSETLSTALYSSELLNGEPIDFSQYGTVTLHYEFAGKNATRNLVIYDAPPVLKLASGIAETVYCFEGAEKITVSGMDVEAIDRVDGQLTLTDKNLSVRVFAPGDEVGKVLGAGGEILPDTVGQYRIEYTITNGTDAAQTISRYVQVLESGEPIITLSGDIPANMNVGCVFELPAATATINGQPLEGLQTAVTYKGESGDQLISVAVEQGKVTFDRAGIYEINYFVEANGKECLLSFRVTVEKDTIGPQISVGEMAATAKVGETFVLPQYSATDDVSGAVDVSVSVRLGTKAIELKDNAFKIEEVGIYTVKFTAVDSSGNESEKILYVEAYGKSKTGGCNSSVGAGAAIAGAAAAAAGLFIMVTQYRKRKEK